jgi:hypothetical protein
MACRNITLPKPNRSFHFPVIPEAKRETEAGVECKQVRYSNHRSAASPA